MNRHRWTVLALLFFSTVLNYVDRQALSILATEVQRDLGMSTAEYARVVQLFLGAYIVGYLVSGRLTDRLGTKLSLALFVGWWSLANLLTGFVQSVAQLGAARTALGLGEAGNYTAAPKAVSEQFPPQERGLAVGIYTAGAMVGATLAPPLIGGLALVYGWRAAFIATGALGFVWLAAWLWLYRAPAQLPPPEARLPVRALLRDRSIWLLASGRLVADPVWYFYLFWFPKYLIEGLGLSLAQVATWAWVVYLAADVGSVGGGWASGRLIRGGVAPASARLRVMAVGACLAPLGALIGGQPGMAATLALGALVAGSHLLFMVNHTALVVDRFPSHSVASAFGFMGMASGLGGMASTQLVGQLVGAHSYALMFGLMACLHPLAWALTWLATRQPHSQEFRRARASTPPSLGDAMNPMKKSPAALAVLLLGACGGGLEAPDDVRPPSEAPTAKALAISPSHTFPPANYHLVFSDEFNGSSVDTAKWNFRTDVKLDSAQRPENVVINNGVAELQLKKENFGGKSYTGAGLISKQGFRYGYFEARAQMHAGGGWHQSIWSMKGDGSNTFNSDRRTEIDASEFDSNNDNQTHMGVHRWQANGSDAPLNCPTSKIQLGFNAAAAYHAYGYEWTETQVKFFVDGQLKCTINFPANSQQHDRVNLWLTAIATTALAGTIEDSALPGAMKIGHAAFYERDHYLDNSDTGYNGYNESGSWADSSLAGYAGSNSRYANSGTAAASWRPFVPVAGTYAVSYWNIQEASNHPAASFQIVANGNTTNLTKNLATAPTGWLSLGTYAFAAGSDGYVRISRASGQTGTIRGDMLKFVRQ